MKRKVKVTLTSSSKERVVTRTGGRAYCPRCGCQVEWIPADDAAAQLQKSKAVIEGQVPWEGLHHVENSEAVERICRRSLLELQRMLKSFRRG